jgi:hypothetical protein
MLDSSGTGTKPAPISWTWGRMRQSLAFPKREESTHDHDDAPPWRKEYDILNGRTNPGNS